MKVLITGVRPYEFTDEKTKKVVKGTSVYFSNSFQERDVKSGCKGLSQGKMTIDDDAILAKLTNVPGFYEAKESYEVFSGTNARLKFLDFKLIKALEI